jgi:hypothetical protein
MFTIAVARSSRDRLLSFVALPIVTALALVAYAAIYGTLALI